MSQKGWAKNKLTWTLYYQRYKLHFIWILLLNLLGLFYNCFTAHSQWDFDMFSVICSKKVKSVFQLWSNILVHLVRHFSKGFPFFVWSSSMFEICELDLWHILKKSHSVMLGYLGGHPNQPQPIQRSRKVSFSDIFLI